MTDEREPPLGLRAYEQLADEYAKRAPTKPFNADLERPTTQGLLPDVSEWMCWMLAVDRVSRRGIYSR
jgi:hypothetical protein